MNEHWVLNLKLLFYSAVKILCFEITLIETRGAGLIEKYVSMRQSGPIRSKASGKFSLKNVNRSDPDWMALNLQTKQYTVVK